MHIDTYIYSDVHIDAPVRVVIIFFRILSFPRLACQSGLPLLLLPSYIYLKKIHKFNVRFSMQVFYKIFTMGKLRSIQGIVLRYFSFMFIIHI